MREGEVPTGVVREGREHDVGVRDELVEFFVGQISVDRDDVVELLRYSDVLRAYEQELERRNRGIVIWLK